MDDFYHILSLPFLPFPFLPFSDLTTFIPIYPSSSILIPVLTCPVLSSSCSLPPSISFPFLLTPSLLFTSFPVHLPICSALSYPSLCIPFQSITHLSFPQQHYLSLSQFPFCTSISSLSLSTSIPICPISTPSLFLPSFHPFSTPNLLPFLATTFLTSTLFHIPFFSIFLFITSFLPSSSFLSYSILVLIIYFRLNIHSRFSRDYRKYLLIISIFILYFIILISIKLLFIFCILHVNC